MWKTVAWEDLRLEINQNSSFWKSENIDLLPGAMLTESFVGECIWTPKLKFYNAFQSVPNLEKSSSTEFYVSKSGKLTESNRSGRSTFSCPMWFSNFPFDVQVTIKHQALADTYRYFSHARLLVQNINNLVFRRFAIWLRFPWLLVASSSTKASHIIPSTNEI